MTIPSSIDSCCNASASPNCKTSKDKGTARTLLERIPIAGLHNLLYAGERKEKLLWSTVLIISAAITLHYFIPCIVNFTKFLKVVEVQHPSYPQLPFPTIHVCGTGAINGTYLNQAFKNCMPHFKNDSRIQSLARRFRMTVPALVWWTIAYGTHEPDFEPTFDQNMVPAFNEILYKFIQAFGSNWPGTKKFYEETAYKCEQFLDQCTLNDVAFPCCGGDAANPILIYTQTCYKLDVSWDVILNGMCEW